MRYKYIHFVCEQDALDARLNQYGAEGWRLHTCEPVATVGISGTGTLHAFVVLDRIDEDAPPAAISPAAEGIAMKG
jgi:hypothetical protein